MINELRPICQQDNFEEFIKILPELNADLIKTVFEISCYNGSFSIMRFVSENCEIPNAGYQVGFMHLAKTNQIKMIHYVFDNEINCENLDQARYELFLSCIAHNQQEIVKELILKNISFISRENFRYFDVAYFNKSDDICTYLIVHDYVDKQSVSHILKEEESYTDKIMCLFDTKELKKKLQNNLLDKENKDLLQKL